VFDRDFSTGIIIPVGLSLLGNPCRRMMAEEVAGEGDGKKFDF
jgi:hypothetical protein